MAKVRMKRIEICALREDRKKILEYLQRKGTVQINRDEDIDDLHKTDMSQNCSIFRKNSQTFSDALEILNTHFKEKSGLLSSLKGRKRISKHTYDEFYKKNDYVLKKAYEVISLDRKMAEEKASRTKMRTQIENLKPYEKLDVSMVNGNTATCTYFVGSFSGEYTLEGIYEKLNTGRPDFPDVHAEVLSASKVQTCVFILCETDDAKHVEDVLRAEGFSYPGFITESSPSERIRKLRAQIIESEGREKEYEERLLAYNDSRDEFRLAQDHYDLRREKYEVISGINQSDHAFFISGYVPAAAGEKLSSDIENEFCAYVRLYDPSEEEDVPVVLKNNRFSEPVTGVVESFGLPAKTDIDPVGIMSVFYYALFGLMFSDAGYGFLLALICGIVALVYKKSDAPVLKMVRMFFWCGISTGIWGLVFGSFFGDAIDVISSTFGSGNAHTPCLWFAPIDDPMKMLIFSMAIGILHMFVGLGINGYTLLKEKKIKDFFFDVVSWFVLLVSLLFILMGSGIFKGIAGFSLEYTQTQKTVMNVGAIVGAAVIVLTAGRESRNPFKRLLKGLYGLYGVTGWLGDVISYSRLLALGLATGVIASVVNQMGAMIGSLPVFIVVFILGHLLNFLINILGAYVHTNRLQFVEFFGKFYQGGGREFKPFRLDSKYYTIEEEKKS